MSKSILIQTDFSVKSLGLIRLVVEENQEQDLSIILGHGYALGSSITELLFYSKQNLLETLISDDFLASLQILKSSFGSRLLTIRVELFNGFTQAAFFNYIDANGITEAYMAPAIAYKFPHSRSFDMNPFIQKSDLKVREVAVAQESSKVMGRSMGTVADLFFTS